VRAESRGPGPVPLLVGAWLVAWLGSTSDGDDSTAVPGGGSATVVFGAVLVVTGPDAVRGARFGAPCAVVVTGAGWVVVTGTGWFVFTGAGWFVGVAAIRGLGGSVVVTGAVATVVGGT
jgi:hypothetical protein